MLFHFSKQQPNPDDTQDSIDYENFLKQQKEEAEKKRKEEAAAAERERAEQERRDAEEDNGKFGITTLA